MTQESDQAGKIPSADSRAVSDAAARLRAGGLVAFPTETVYGLGADATDERAVACVFQAKGRPKFNPLIAHFADAAAVRSEAVWCARADALAARFWPGALTLVLPRRPDGRAALLCSAGLDSLAARVPSHPLAKALLTEVGRPVAAPSANRSGAVSPTTAEHVRESLGGQAGMILDGGPCDLGLESTVIDLTADPPRLLRPGGVTRAELESVVGPLAGDAAPDGRAPKAPGQLASHYAPSLPLRLDATTVAADEALLAFGPDPPRGACQTLNLSARGDLVEAAARLFAQRRALDAARPTSGAKAIAAMPIPADGLGEAIDDRLRRAAAPRPPNTAGPSGSHPLKSRP